MLMRATEQSVDVGGAGGGGYLTTRKFQFLSVIAI